MSRAPCTLLGRLAAERECVQAVLDARGEQIRACCWLCRRGQTLAASVYWPGALGKAIQSGQIARLESMPKAKPASAKPNLLNRFPIIPRSPERPSIVSPTPIPKPEARSREKSFQARAPKPRPNRPDKLPEASKSAPRARIISVTSGPARPGRAKIKRSWPKEELHLARVVRELAELGEGRVQVMDLAARFNELAGEAVEPVSVLSLGRLLKRVKLATARDKATGRKTVHVTSARAACLVATRLGTSI